MKLFTFNSSPGNDIVTFAEKQKLVLRGENVLKLFEDTGGIYTDVVPLLEQALEQVFSSYYGQAIIYLEKALESLEETLALPRLKLLLWKIEIKALLSSPIIDTNLLHRARS